MTVPRELQGLRVGDLDPAQYQGMLERGQELGNHGSWVWYEREQKSAWSPSARRILGHGETDVVWLFDLVHPDDRGIRSHDTFVFAAEPKTIEYRILRHSDKAVRWIRETGVAELDDDEKPIRIFGSITDITDEHPAEHGQRALLVRIETADLDTARRLLPRAVMDAVERGDLDLATRYLDAVPFDREPASIVLARLAIASSRQSVSEWSAIVDSLEHEGRLDELIAEEPSIGAFASNFFIATGQIERAENICSRISPGRAAEAARLLLSATRDDPDAPIPSMVGDVLDDVIARTLYALGRLSQLRQAATPALAVRSGVPVLIGALKLHELKSGVAPQTGPVVRIARAIDMRDLDAARAAVVELDAVNSPYASLLEAEVAIRLQRDPHRALAAVERLRTFAIARLTLYREFCLLWEGAAHLLLGANEAAAAALRDSVASMRRGARTVLLPTALVYLAEAEWRLGNEDECDGIVDEAYDVAHAMDSLGQLLRSFSNFPGVLSRRLDAEADAESVWHALGRGLIRRDSSSPLGYAGAYLREFGDAVLVTETGEALRPKIRKSLELLSFLLSQPSASASRSEVLTALWNGRDDESTRAYLRQALRQLRSAFHPVVDVITDGDTLSVAGAVTSASMALDSLVCAAAAEEGEQKLDLLLEGIAITRRGLFLDGSQAVEWVDDRRAKFDDLATDMRLDAAALLLEADRHLEALDLVDEALAADPLAERGWRLRMTALGLLGDSDGVALAYRRCRATLARIGLEPSRATIEVANAFRP